MTIAKAIGTALGAVFVLLICVTVGVCLMVPLVGYGCDYLTLHRVYSFTQYAVTFGMFMAGGGIIEWAARQFIGWFQNPLKGIWRPRTHAKR